MLLKPTPLPRYPPARPPTHPALHSSLLRPCPTSQPSRQAAPRSLAALATAAVLLHSVCLLPGQPPPHGNDATRPAGEALQPRLPRSHLLELYRKEGGIGARSATRGFSLCLCFLSLSVRM